MSESHAFSTTNATASPDAPAATGSHLHDDPDEAYYGQAEYEALRAGMREKEAQLAESNARIAEHERQRALDEALTAAGVIDLAAGRAAAMKALDGDSALDPTQVVALLVNRQPALFHAHRRPGAMSARLDPAMHVGSTLSRSAQAARESGSRTELLSYLRLRRKR